jgi:hypothetical protein
MNPLGKLVVHPVHRDPVHAAHLVPHGPRHRASAGQVGRNAGRGAEGRARQERIDRGGAPGAALRGRRRACHGGAVHCAVNLAGLHAADRRDGDREPLSSSLSMARWSPASSCFFC